MRIPLGLRAAAGAAAAVPIEPTGPFTSDANTVLLLECEGANGSTNFIDLSPSPKTVTVGTGITISTANSRFGDSSALFPSTDAALTVTDGAFAFASGDSFTWEGFIYYSKSTALKALFNSDTTYTNRPRLYINGTTLSIYVSPSFRLSHQTAVSIDTWHHVAAVRDGTVWHLYLDGVQSTSSYTELNNPTTSTLMIGWDGFGGQDFEGYMDSIRVSDVARYTASFTPPW